MYPLVDDIADPGPLPVASNRTCRLDIGSKDQADVTSSPGERVGSKGRKRVLVFVFWLGDHGVSASLSDARAFCQCQNPRLFLNNGP